MPDVDTAIVERLLQHRTLKDAPRAELEWLAAHGTIVPLTTGPLLPQDPAIMETLVIMLSGHFSIYVDHGAGPHKVMEWSAGDVSGYLPYSRMSKPIGEMQVDEAGE